MFSSSTFSSVQELCKERKGGCFLPILFHALPAHQVRAFPQTAGVHGPPPREALVQEDWQGLGEGGTCEASAGARSLALCDSVQQPPGAAHEHPDSGNPAGARNPHCCWRGSDSVHSMGKPDSRVLHETRPMLGLRVSVPEYPIKKHANTYPYKDWHANIYSFLCDSQELFKRRSNSRC